MNNKIKFAAALLLLSTINFQLSTAFAQGTALSFSGGEYVSVPNNAVFDLTSAVTLEAWIKTVQGVDGYIMTKGDDSFYLAVGPSGTTANKLSFYLHLSGVNSGWVQGTTSLNDGSWHHVCATYDGATMKVYVDGGLENSLAISGNLSTETNTVRIAERPNVSTTFAGTMDEVRIWNVARTQAQIQANMHQSLSLPQPGLVAYWQFNEGAGNYAYDASGNGNTGTLEDGPLWVDSTVPFFPFVATQPASAISTNMATLNGTVVPDTTPTIAWFQWGPDTNYGFSTSATNVGSGTNIFLVQNTLTGISSGSTYHYQLVATNQYGQVAGGDEMFQADQEETNIWVSPLSGKWENPENWSAGAPSAAQLAIFITNPGSKTVTIDSLTAGGYPSIMAVSNLTVGAMNGTDLDTLGLLGFPTNTPFLVDNLLLQSGSSLIISNAALEVDALTDTNSDTEISFPSGLVTLLDSSVSSGSPVLVGDGIHSATLNLSSGNHTLANGLIVNSNAMLTIGCATINAPIINYGTIVVTCPSSVPFQQSVLNEGTIIAQGGVVGFAGSVTNQGELLAANGGDFQFYGLMLNIGEGDIVGGQPPVVEWVQFANLATGTLTNATIQVTVRFDKPMYYTNLSNAALYNFLPGQVTSAVPSADDQSVNLTIAKAPLPGGQYTLIMNNMMDTAGHVLTNNLIQNTTPFYMIDYALSGVAIQSSIGMGAGPQLAIDGNTDGNFSDGSVTFNAQPENPAWWQVDLTAQKTVGEISVWFRTDCCNGLPGVFGAARDDNFTVKAMDASSNVIWSQTYPGTPGANVAYDFNPPLQARYVRVQSQTPLTTSDGYFSLAEVEVVAPFTNYSLYISQDLPPQVYFNTNNVAVLGPVAATVVNADPQALQFQWQTNQVNIPGATNDTYIVAANSNPSLQYQCKLSVLNQAVYSHTTLALQEPPPHVVGASYFTNGPNINGITIFFDRIINPISVSNISNFQLSSGTVLGANLTGAGNSVYLIVTGLGTPGSAYAIITTNIADSTGYGYGMSSTFNDTVLGRVNPSPELAISSTVSNIVINWPGYGQLMHSTSVSGPWAALSNAPPLTEISNSIPQQLPGSVAFATPMTGGSSSEFFYWSPISSSYQASIDDIDYTNAWNPGILLEGTPVCINFSINPVIGLYQLGPTAAGEVKLALVDPKGQAVLEMEQPVPPLNAYTNFTGSFCFCAPTSLVYTVYLQYLTNGPMVGEVGYEEGLISEAQQKLDVGLRLLVSLDSVTAFQTVSSEGDLAYATLGVANNVYPGAYTITDEITPYNWSEFNSSQSGLCSLVAGPFDYKYADLKAHQFAANISSSVYVAGQGSSDTFIADDIFNWISKVCEVIYEAIASYEGCSGGCGGSQIDGWTEDFNNYLCQEAGGCKTYCSGIGALANLPLPSSSILAMPATPFAFSGILDNDEAGTCSSAQYQMNYSLHRESMVYIVDIYTPNGQSRGINSTTSEEVSMGIEGTSLCGDQVLQDVDLQNPYKPDPNNVINKNNHPFGAGTTSSFMFVCPELSSITDILLSKGGGATDKPGWLVGDIWIRPACNAGSQNSSIYWHFGSSTGTWLTYDDIHIGYIFTPNSLPPGPPLTKHCFLTQ